MMRFLERARLTREIAREAAFDPKAFIRKAAPEVERITGWAIEPSLVDKLKIRECGLISRGLLRAWARLGFGGGSILGFSITRRSITINRKCAIANLVAEYDIAEVKAKPDTKAWLVEEGMRIMQTICLHEFVHYVHRNVRPQDHKGLSHCLRLMLPAIGARRERERREMVMEMVRDSITHEVIAFGTTHLASERLGFEDTTVYDGCMEGLAVETFLNRMDQRVIHRLEFISMLFRFAHPLAELFVLRILGKYGEDAVREVLERKPTYNDLIWNPHKF